MGWSVWSSRQMAVVSARMADRIRASEDRGQGIDSSDDQMVPDLQFNCDL